MRRLPILGKKRGALAILLLAALFSGVLAQATAASVVDVEITQLLDYVERSGCALYRNGSWYSASDARAHLERKYRSLLDKGGAGTTEDFIDRAATASSLSGKPYHVKCEGREQVSSAEWLTVEMLRLRRASAATTP
ncbi:MAG: DUF5329 domain-containing protein [Nitrospiraceae bacterium]